LRLRPDRILVGEVRGEEAFDLLQALNTGHRGTLSTAHANSAAASLERFITCALMANTKLPHAAVCRQIGQGVQLLVHLDSSAGSARSAKCCACTGTTWQRTALGWKVSTQGREHSTGAVFQCPSGLGDALRPLRPARSRVLVHIGRLRCATQPQMSPLL